MSKQTLAPPVTIANNETTLPFMTHVMTADVALAEPSLQEFLVETDLVIDYIDNVSFDPLETPYWPSWTSG